MVKLHFVGNRSNHPSFQRFPLANYDDTMPIDFLDNYETQMKALDFWNIVEVEKNIN